MFTQHVVSQISINFCSYLEMFLGLIALHNQTLFRVANSELVPFQTVYEQYEADLVRVLPLNDLLKSEVLLTKFLMEDSLFTLKFNHQVNAHDSLSEVHHFIHDVWAEGGEMLWNRHERIYEQWCANVDLRSIHDIAVLIEKLTSNPVSDSHLKLLEQASAIHVIPSVYVFPQVGYNLIGDQLYLLLGISPANNRSMYLDLDMLASAFNALGEVKRLQILKLLKEKEDIQGVDIAKEIHLTPATVSHHLSLLVQAGLISREREGRVTRYVIEPGRLKAIKQFTSEIL